MDRIRGAHVELRRERSVSLENGVTIMEVCMEVSSSRKC